jgi:hypothetical protein
VVYPFNYNYIKVYNLRQLKTVNNQETQFKNNMKSCFLIQQIVKNEKIPPRVDFSFVVSLA